MIKAIPGALAVGVSLMAFMGTGFAASLPGKPAPGASDVHAVATKCWWKDGVRRCARVAKVQRERNQEQPIYYNSYPPERAEAYRTGSREWWQAMDRDRRGGFPDN